MKRLPRRPQHSEGLIQSGLVADHLAAEPLVPLPPRVMMPWLLSNIPPARTRPMKSSHCRLHYRRGTRTACTVVMMPRRFNLATGRCRNRDEEVACPTAMLGGSSSWRVVGRRPR